MENCFWRRTQLFSFTLLYIKSFFLLVNLCRIYVIPNAIEASIFKPDPSKRPVGRIQIVTVSRLAMRKGTDLLAGVISKVR